MFDLRDKAHDIAFENKEGLINFDFLLLQEQGDPLYHPSWPWLHANSDRRRGGVVKLSDNNVFERQKKFAEGFGDPYYCVTCERDFEIKRKHLFKLPNKNK